MPLSVKNLQFIKEHLFDDVRTLALNADKYPEVGISEAIVQIVGRQSIEKKIPSWYATEGIYYPRCLPLEQCSSEATARYKALLIKGEVLTDLTGGFGIDCAFLSSSFHKVAYVECQKELCELAANNFPLLGHNHIVIKNEDAIHYLRKMKRVDCIYMDPARRDRNRKKQIKLADCEPDISKWEDLLLLKATKVMIKLSPMLDISQALYTLRRTKEIHIVSVHNECKELLLLLENNTDKEIPIHCINITGNKQDSFVFTREEEQSAACIYTNKPETFLYEPNVSILKAGAFRSISYRYGTKKFHPNSHLYTSNTFIEDFPGRCFIITETYSFHKKEWKKLLSNLPKAHIAIRNFPATVDELRKRIKLQGGGDVYLFATTLADESKIFIRCEKVSVFKNTNK
jgi:16S rRNA G966 N2-methylase RsmD